jgi:hypothetical protein
MDALFAQWSVEPTIPLIETRINNYSLLRRFAKLQG